MEITIERFSKVKEEAEEFYKSLNVKREQIRIQADQLSEKKAIISEEVDVPAFIKMLVTEAKRVGLSVYSIKPAKENKEQFYIEQNFF